MTNYFIFATVETRKNILVAPLNWGLGHATRCIPIIRQLLTEGFQPIIASDGAALALLQREFPDLQHLELPSYHIAYAKNPKNFKWKLLKNSPKTIAAIFEEKRLVRQWIAQYHLAGIISDNRLGVYSKKIPSAIITHQLTVLSGKTTWISSGLHRFFIQKFQECWVPDWGGAINLSGKLGHPEKISVTTRYIGVLSRLVKKDVPKTINYLILLSGPEPQRSLLEEKLKQEMQHVEGQIVLIRGVVEPTITETIQPPFTIYNYLTSERLSEVLNAAEVVICRSGYTTIMDLAKLEKKAFFIPTPGQFEQEYLAKRLHRDGNIPQCSQKDFKCEKLDTIPFYKGLPKVGEDELPKDLFSLF
ncbi:glycosyltransferase [Flavobacterium sp.]|uniref:glycosyltransferase n=1 Tax=Flavobacterium sp. TaxID=239 RepID=UPI002615FC52|nr:glycosyltransferase [Flavobacterium sp.]